MALNVEVVSTDQTLWSGEAVTAVVPAADGEMGILPGHSPVLAVLRQGSVRITPSSGEKVSFDVVGGFVSFDHDSLTVVVEKQEIEIEGMARVAAPESEDAGAEQAPAGH
ncbi:H+transporting two-sector ATPase delta/epsilon subunit [Beutenbergia cavernae DSM 12333]|uniref:ATP synthase epsilon chain n=1 Tax=Beutenbergia cavernae (strain ATCC BAA-8 / DSM 12333 / CCUG 43141 / JCM 11478 / NBRC 16432 / NCIMB 13614 / HKI 0122) TaxID=471853 RepID=C5C1U9_BEUC1|nr:F0F1 ATP synthase subunit epsilon [Beutenbergia cavernae]ACQ79567.1 H+transporting two-sector ATPase delta/epsilon subunit [Beutenbergia cavernae DSM 12333]